MSFKYPQPERDSSVVDEYFGTKVVNKTTIKLSTNYFFIAGERSLSMA